MRKQEAKIEYPHIRVEIGDKVFELKDWTGEVKGYDDLRSKFVAEPFMLFRRVLLELQHGLEAKLTLEQDSDTEISLPLKMTGEKWQVVITMSKQSIQAGSGKSIPIRFMSLLHRALHQVRYGSTFPYGKARSIVTLQSLGLLKGYTATQKGEEVLAQLQELGPPEGNKGLLMIANELLSIDKEVRNPLRFWLRANNFTTPMSTHISAPYKLTDMGRAWLEQNGVDVLQLRGFTQHRALIAFLPLEALNVFLASDDEALRQRARERVEALGGDAENG